MLSLAGTLLAALLAGAAARMLVPGPGPGGLVVTLLLGLGGGALAGLAGPDGGLLRFLLSVAGALLLLLGLRVLARWLAPLDAPLGESYNSGSSIPPRRRRHGGQHR